MKEANGDEPKVESQTLQRELALEGALIGVIVCIAIAGNWRWKVLCAIGVIVCIAIAVAVAVSLTSTPKLHTIEASVRLPLSKPEFTAPKQTSFREAVAASAGVDLNNVTITSIADSSGQARRLLLASSIDVAFRVKGALKESLVHPKP
ncbi:hypothetical protein T484DRAFT_1855883 [Baffinella frigidus]|nr:hypothetical protein T484DRAFT_1855883 [Cryptophyta sp. CCMP2293]